MAVIDTSRDLPESCEKCWKRDCRLYGIEWMSISSADTYRDSRDKNCPLKSLSDMKSDLDRVCHTFGLSIVEAKKMMVDIVNEYAGDKTGEDSINYRN